MTIEQIHKAFYENSTNAKSVESIDSWILNFPQVSLFQTIKAKQLQTKSDPNYRKQLKKAAIFSPNRRTLYKYLIQPEVVKQINTVEDEVVAREPTELIKASNVSKTEKIKEAPTNSLQPEVEKERRILEQEILNHAISSSIILESSEPEENEKGADVKNIQEDQPVEKDKASEFKLPENYNSLGVLDWLKIDLPKNEASNKQKANPQELISTFIKKDPNRIKIETEKSTIVNIERTKQEFFSPENMAKMSLMEDGDLVTETLAGIYAKQGNYSKAKKAYKKLSLKFPEKSNYFARLIKELGNKH